MDEGLFEFARQIATHLDRWQFLDPQPFGHAACLGGPGGAGLTVGVSGFGDFGPGARVEVSGRWPEAKRGPKAVAGDVERRLLPKYLPLYEEMAERKARHLAKEARRRECLERLAAASGDGDLGRVVGKLRIDAPGKAWGYAEVGVWDDGETVSFELHSVPFGKALELVKVFAGRS